MEILGKTRPRGRVALRLIPGGRLALLALAPLALAFLLGHQLRDNPFFANQLSDDRLLLGMARDVAEGRGFGPVPFWVNPLYPYLLAFLAKTGIAGTAGSIRAVQAVLGAAIFPLVFLLGRRYFGSRAGWVAYGLALGYGVLLHSVTEISSAWLETLLVLLLLAALPSRWRPPAHHLFPGAVAGALALCRPTYLPLGLLLPALGWWRGRRGKAGGPGGGGAAALFFLAAFLLVVLPVTLRNLVVGKDLVAVSSHGGINFYIGNSPWAEGQFYPPPGFRPDPFSINRTDALGIAEGETGRPLKPSQASRFWTAKGLGFLASHPASALALYGKKLLLFAHAFETPLNSDYAFFAGGSSLLGLLGLPFPLLLASGGMGIALSWRRRGELSPALLVLAVQALSLLGFFVASRYRLPMAPVLAIFAGEAAAAAGGALRSRPLRAAGAIAGVAAFTTALLSLPYPFIEGARRASAASTLERLGVFEFDQGRMDPAFDLLTRAAGIRPERGDTHWYLARILESRGDPGGASKEWLAASRAFEPGSRWAEESWKNYLRTRLPGRPGGPPGPSGDADHPPR